MYIYFFFNFILTYGNLGSFCFFKKRSVISIEILSSVETMDSNQMLFFFKL